MTNPTKDDEKPKQLLSDEHRAKVKALVLKDLEEYWSEAEEHEDLADRMGVPLEQEDPRDRAKDFYLYQYEKDK